MAAPYVVSQQNALTRVPEFLNTQHQIASSADAEAYLERISALARRLDQESALIAEHAARGVMPPNFIAANALGQRVRFRQRPVTEQPLVNSLVARTKAQGIRARGTPCVGAGSIAAVSGTRPADCRLYQGHGVSRHGRDLSTTGRRRLLPLGSQAWHNDRSERGEVSIGLDQNRAIQARIDDLQVTRLTQAAWLSAAQRPRQLVANTIRAVGAAGLLHGPHGGYACARAQISSLGLKAPLMVKQCPWISRTARRSAT